jgi:hypothetical protein
MTAIKSPVLRSARSLISQACRSASTFFACFAHASRALDGIGSALLEEAMVLWA